MGFSAGSARGSSRTTQQIVERFDEIVRRADAPEQRSRPIDVDTVEALEELLISADIGVAATDRIIAAVTAGSRATAPACATWSSRKSAASSPPSTRRSPSTARPQVTLIVGVNGTGKTTTVGKLAQPAQEPGARRRSSAPPTRSAPPRSSSSRSGPRAPASTSCARATAPIRRAVVFDAITSGKAKGRDPILVDTAGRLHTRVNLMNELEKIRRIAAREVPGAPQEVLLVLDATVGQNGVAQAREFMSVAGVNGIVLTKLDGTAKGGVAVAIAARSEAADPLRRRRRGDRRPGAVFRRRNTSTALFRRNGDVKWSSATTWSARCFTPRAAQRAHQPQPARRRRRRVGGRRRGRAGLPRARRRAARRGARARRRRARARAARRCTARSSRAATRAAPARASAGSSTPASRGSSRRSRIRIRRCAAAASRSPSRAA